MASPPTTLASPPTTLDGRVQAALAGRWNIQLSSAEITAALGNRVIKERNDQMKLNNAKYDLGVAQRADDEYIAKLTREGKYVPTQDKAYRQRAAAQQVWVAIAQKEVDSNNEFKNDLNRLKVQAERREAAVAASKAAEDAKRQAELKPPPAKVAAVIKDQSKGLPISEEAKLTEGKVKSKLRKPLSKLKKRRR